MEYVSSAQEKTATMDEVTALVGQLAENADIQSVWVWLGNKEGDS
jgi:hypothetical protein